MRWFGHVLHQTKFQQQRAELWFPADPDLLISSDHQWHVIHSEELYKRGEVTEDDRQRRWRTRSVNGEECQWVMRWCYGGSQNLKGRWCEVDVYPPYLQVIFVKDDYTSSIALYWLVCTWLMLQKSLDNREACILWVPNDVQPHRMTRSAMSPWRPVDSRRRSCPPQKLVSPHRSNVHVYSHEAPSNSHIIRQKQRGDDEGAGDECTRQDWAVRRSLSEPKV